MLKDDKWNGGKAQNKNYVNRMEYEIRKVIKPVGNKRILVLG